MLSIKDSEMFYTCSPESTDEELFVDQISIDKESKEYFLQKNVPEHITNGYLPGGFEINSFYVSRFVFDIILDGVKRSEFKEAIYVR